MQFSDREFYWTTADRPAESIERPIIAANEIGMTVVSKDPMTGGNIIQNVDAAIRQGVSKIQLVFNQQHNNPVGGGAKAFGKDVRENLRELSRVNGIKIEGVEMPTSSMTNMSGFDPQGRMISEEKRQKDINEIKEAIKFIADVGGGGGVDIWSQEFSRNIIDAKWNQQGRWKGQFEEYSGEERDAVEHLVDTRTGEVKVIRHSDDIVEPIFKRADKDVDGLDVDGKPVHIRKGEYVTIDDRRIDERNPEHLLMRVPEWDNVNKKFKVDRISWQDVVKRTDDYNKEYGTELDPAEYAFKIKLDNSWMQARGHSLFYTRSYQDEVDTLKKLQQSLEHYQKIEATVPEDEMWRLAQEDPHVRTMFTAGEFRKPTELISREIDRMKHNLKHVHESSAASDAQAEEIQRTKDSMKSVKKFARDKAISSYAELGIAAYDETKMNKNAQREIHVGPEIGWPTGYGGHPEEFIELIKGARNKMAEDLVKQRGFSKEEASRVAKEHIKGVFDTGHMGMWLQHFKKDHPQESEEQRLGRFKGWYMDMVAKMQKEDVIGGVQAVDSAGSGHEHLPAGQGILPVVEAVDYLRSHGFNGFLVSEGHGEEGYGRGRMLLETWRAFGSDIASSYFDSGKPTRWLDNPEYLGGLNPPPYVLGSYRPTDEWTLWSGVPLE